MNSLRSKYFVVGLVMWVTILILFFGMIFLNDSNPGETKHKYHLMFNDVSTLGLGDPVKVNGVKVGKVTELQLLVEERRVRVNIEVVDSVKIPKNSTIKIQNIGLLGERQIGIVMGDDPAVLQPGDQVEGQLDAGISEAMAFAGEVFDSTRTLLATVRNVVDSTIGTEQFKTSFHNIVNNAEALENKLAKMLNETDPVLSSSLRNLKQASIKVNEMIDENRAPVQTLLTQSNTLTTDAQKVMLSADSITARLMNITARLEASDNTAGALLNDKEFYTDISGTLNAADSLFRVIIQDGLDVNVDIF